MKDGGVNLIEENIANKFSEIEERELDIITEFIKNAGQYQEIGNYVIFRLFNAVSQREEVFVGNVLFNNYISKLLLRAYRVNEKYTGRIELIYNDLENFYYVIEQENIDEFSLKELLEDDFKDYFEENLEELFFEDEDLEKGIYGEFKNLMLGQGSNYISLPLTILPSFFEKKFKDKFIENLDSFSNQEQISMMALYWSATGSEMQSYDKFFSKELLNPQVNIEPIKHILNNDENKKIEEIRKIGLELNKQKELINLMKDLYLLYFQQKGEFGNFNIKLLNNKYFKKNIEELPTVSNTILSKIIKANNLLESNRLLEFFEEVKKLKNKMKAKKYNLLRTELERVLKTAENNLVELKEISSFNKVQNLDGYDFEGFDNFKNQLIDLKNISYQKEKLLNLDKEKYISEIFKSITIVPRLNKKNIKENKCYVCYNNIRRVTSKNLLTGGKEEKFTNDNNDTSKNICLKCSIYIWLKLKYLGTYYSGNVFPEKRNLVFFYGQIPDERINQIQGILNSLYYCTQNSSVYTYEMIDESIEELEKDNLEEESSEVDDLLQKLIESDEENNERPAKVPPTIWSWYKNGQQSDKVNTHIFSVGQGENKLYTFILPYALGRSDEVQKKFSQNRVAVFSMLSFLSRLTGGEGNFYYLSIPRLTDKFDDKNIFYYKDKAKRGSLKEYELLTEVAWKLVNPQSVSGRTYIDRQENAFKKRLRLANDLERLPLICISKVYRELLSDKKGSNYNNLSNIWNEKVSSPNLFPLIKVSNRIRKEVKFMGQKIDTKELKAFTEKLFSELVLISGVFPKRFSKSPTEFEKYPRLLIKKILKYDTEEGKDVLAGYREWSTKLLHSAKGFYDKDKKKIAERIEKIRQYVIEHQEVLSRKGNLLYLKRSLFGWIMEFLYPLYNLVEEINVVIDECKGEEIEKAKEFDEVKKIRDKFLDMEYDFEKFFSIAKELLINNQNYYKLNKNKEDE